MTQPLEALLARDTVSREPSPSVGSGASPAASATAPPKGRERPSTHGLIVGQALTAIASSVAGALPSDCCATCAFRPECMTNQMASTALVAFKCAVGVDPDPFGCHHGMKDGEPTKICAGWLASQLAEFSDVKRISAEMCAALAGRSEGDPDPVRQAFDAWIARVDPTGAMNDYQRGRLYLRHRSEGTYPATPDDPSCGEAIASGQTPGGHK